MSTDHLACVDDGIGGGASANAGSTQKCITRQSELGDGQVIMDPMRSYGVRRPRAMVLGRKME
jgi:hypothetical protein